MKELVTCCRRLSLLPAMLALFALLGACTDPVPVESPAPGQGTLVFQLAEDTARSVLGTELSAGLANTWELLLVDSAGILTTLKMEAGQTASLSLAPGDYRVLVLAGFRRSTTSVTTQMLGSAFAENPVTVVENQSQTLTLTLKAIDFTFTCPATAEAGGSFTCTASGKTRNPYVGMGIEGSASVRPRLRSTTLWDGYHDFTTLTGTSLDWSATANLLAPSAVGTADLGFCGSALLLVACGSADGSLTGRTIYSWKWPNTYDLQEGDILKSLVQTSVSVVVPATGIGVTLVWE